MSYGLNFFVLPKFVMLKPQPNVAVFEDGAFKNVIKIERFNETIKVGP